ncbi:cell cycle protein [Paenibacillus darwinianus]|uniref:Cell cycle protein n=1 Tax=Paenibacillus darwinianus TaxID=1380763 RepID=A0A9W5RYW6_9BACL|nr:FtsW/RodA/SpoVE family cell cycle protein [Paenibacillus darwinianus]EXX85138.1 cell cycle protein [Paenibacillus darwinianus]EXX90083.1 cell cycle protein [Paenibacillus darwinianus]EXX91357.1 cell cycle protein [Paenibacillus darwinianus]
MLNKFKKLDWGILLILALFMVMSTLLVRSATYGNPDYLNYDLKQLIFYAVGFVVAIGSTLFDYRLFLKGWFVLYGIGIALLVLVYFVGDEINGARSWFTLPGGLLSFQPAEFMKIILIITVAVLIGRRQGDRLSLTSDLLPIAAFSMLPFVIVMIQPDLGNAIIYVVIVLGMLWIGNVKYTHVLIGLTVVVGTLILFVNLFNLFNTEIKDYLTQQNKEHWYARINTYINPETASAKDKYQSEKSLIAIGSGGLTGDGYMEGDSKNRRFIPYPYSDSIFVVIGEEFGFQGSAVLLLLYFLLIYRMILIAFQCYDLKGSFIIIGIVSMFVFQIFENIGMMIGIMPITGITLPFISYGGTSLLLNMLSIGLVFSIKAHQEKYELD